MERAEQRRVAALAGLDTERQKDLGQFFTPAAAAALIASLPVVDELPRRIRVLDPGAGSGSLTAAMVERLTVERPDAEIHVVAVEKDPLVTPALAETLRDCERYDTVTTDLVAADFLTASTGLDPDPRLIGQFDLVIMNPPYGKQAKADHLRRSVARELVDTPNLYSAFWALAVAALAPDGQCAAIVPRSWANGSYFASFRRWLLDRVRIDHVHVFESRSTVFADTGVLQENIIISVTRTIDRTAPVTLSASLGHVGEVTRRSVPASAVVQPHDSNRFVRLTDGVVSVSTLARHTLSDLGLRVSTGRVVDFRVRAHLGEDPSEPGTAPLVYPGNITGGSVEWPRKIRKPQTLRVVGKEVEKHLLEPGVYVLIKRFSAKEEPRRVVAGVWERSDLSPAFENHLNYLHEDGRPLALELARGLCAWLNTTALDDFFRTFSGHTQVNAGDLRVLPYPSREHLELIGREVGGQLPGQAELDALVDRVLLDRTMVQ